MWSYVRKILEKSIREKLPVIDLQVHLSQTYMQVLDCGRIWPYKYSLELVWEGKKLETLLQGARSETPFNKMLIDYVE
jgi:hypothetical protein